MSDWIWTASLIDFAEASFSMPAKKSSAS